jgi:hypothetical protein
MIQSVGPADEILQERTQFRIGPTISTSPRQSLLRRRSGEDEVLRSSAFPPGGARRDKAPVQQKVVTGTTA